MTAGPFRRVLVGWDASADATEALSAAAAIVRGGAGHVVALTVVPDARGSEAAGQRASEFAIRRRAEDRFERMRESAADGVRMSLHIVEDRQVGRAVCTYAAEHGFDLLVLGRHGDGAARRTRLGRVAEAAAKDSAVPVLLLSAE